MERTDQKMLKRSKMLLCALLLAALALPALAEGATPWIDRVESLEWFGEGENVLKKDEYGLLYDIETGISLRIKRMGGHNHADVEPATAADTAKLLQLNGGKFGWESHACILYANGRYVTCAINTKPHGQQTLRDNGYNGQFCLHMTGSITHGSRRVNACHQAAIADACAWAGIQTLSAEADAKTP